MSVLKWVDHVLGATLRFAINLVVVTGLYLLSAHLIALGDPDALNAGYAIRVIASFWLYIAGWSWFVRGLLRVAPRQPTPNRKLTATDVAKGIGGCLLILLLIPFLVAVAGGAADWAWEGIASGNPAHPARQWADRAIELGTAALDRPGDWLPYAIGLSVAYRILRNILRNVGSQQQTPADSGAREQAAASANAETLARLRKRSGKSKGSRTSPGLDALAAATRPRTEAASQVERAHAGAHGTAPRQSSGRDRHEDRVLGRLTFNQADNAWWTHGADREFSVRIEGDATAPDPRALDAARGVVQRSFEATLRASDAVRPVAQSRGVGLPRFRIAAVRVRAGDPASVYLHLRCDSDKDHDYVAVSTDGLQTYTRA